MRELKNFVRLGKSARVALAVVAFAAVAGMSPGHAEDQLLKVRVQTIGANAATVPDLYARVFGLYKQAGLDPEFPPPIYHANGAMQMVIQGSADVAYSGGSSVIQAVQQGRKIKVFGVVLRGLELKISLTKAGMEKAQKLGVTAESPVKDRALALRGMRLAAPATGSSSDLVFRYSLKRFGIDPAKDLTIQPMSDIPTIMAAVRQGVVDGVAGTASTANARAEAEGVATRFIAFEEDDPLLQNYPLYTLATTDDFLAKNPEVARRLLNVFASAKKAIRRGLTPEETATIKKEFFPDMDEKALAYGLSISLPLLKAPLEPQPIMLEALLKTNNAVADVPANISFEQAFAPKLAAEADGK
jgi:ABC-type nitrate/sulfonate/bicarbonate transport system substrate-binding protein